MEIVQLTLGLYQTNCYIVYDPGQKRCCVIDPGYEAETILDRVNGLGLTVEAILLTHGHFDHVGAVAEIAAETDCAGEVVRYLAPALPEAGRLLADAEARLI